MIPHQAVRNNSHTDTLLARCEELFERGIIS
jgi:hypothetical protein